MQMDTILVAQIVISYSENAKRYTHNFLFTRNR